VSSSNSNYKQIIKPEHSKHIVDNISLNECLTLIREQAEVEVELAKSLERCGFNATNFPKKLEAPLGIWGMLYLQEGIVIYENFEFFSEKSLRKMANLSLFLELESEENEVTTQCNFHSQLNTDSLNTLRRNSLTLIK
jgi:hypothetical protein